MKNKIIGGLMGFAIGDALGMPLEGVPTNIRNTKYPKVIDTYMNPVKESLTRELKKGMYTDDTQILFSTIKSLNIKNEFNPEDIAKRLITLRGKNKETMKLRAPGWSTIYGIDKMRKKIIEEPDESKKWNYSECGKQNGLGSGSALRTFTLDLFLKDEHIEEKIKEFNNMTHKNEETLSSTYLIIKSLNYLSQNEIHKLKDSRKMLDYLLAENKITKSREIKNRLQKMYMQMHIDENIDISSTGIRGVCYQVVSSGLYSFLTQPNNFRKSIAQTISLGGDSDSRGAVAGLLTGFNLGIEKIDKDLIQGLENNYDLLKISKEFAYKSNNKN